MLEKLARYKKAIAAVLAGAAVVVAAIPLDADPRLIAVGQLVTALAVLLGPANRQPIRSRQELAERVERIGGYPSGSRLASEMPPPSTGVRRPFSNHDEEG